MLITHLIIILKFYLTSRIPMLISIIISIIAMLVTITPHIPITHMVAMLIITNKPYGPCVNNNCGPSANKPYNPHNVYVSNPL